MEGLIARLLHTLGESAAIFAASPKLPLWVDVEVVRAFTRLASLKASELCVVERCQDVRDHHLLVDVHTENLSLLVHANDSVRGLVFRSDENRFTRDAIHVDARAGLDIGQMNEPVIRHDVDNSVLLGGLHGYREVVRRLWREVHVDSLLRKWRVRAAWSLSTT